MARSLTQFRIPHVFTLLTGVVFACSLLTFVIPSGEYERATLDVGGHERTVVVPDTYTTLPKHYSLAGLLFHEEVAGKASPVSLEGFLSAIPRGMVIELVRLVIGSAEPELLRSFVMSDGSVIAATWTE